MPDGTLDSDLRLHFIDLDTGREEKTWKPVRYIATARRVGGWKLFVCVGGGVFRRVGTNPLANFHRVAKGLVDRSAGSGRWRRLANRGRLMDSGGRHRRKRMREAL